MTTRDKLKHLVELAGPYWAGEREVVWTYFESDARSRESDRLWLRRQCFKEIWGSGVGDREKGLFQAQAAYLNKVFPRIDREVDRHTVLQAAEALRSEFAHYCLFADIHDALTGEKLDPSQLEGWAADDELARMRYEIRDRLGKLGDTAVLFTEGGCGSMYLAGMQLAGRGGFDDRIARACEEVYRDEIGHMRGGIVGLALAELSGAEWDEVSAAISRILLQRLHMRNEQFGFPVSAGRIRAIEAGDIEPMTPEGLSDDGPGTGLGRTLAGAPGAFRASGRASRESG